MIFVPLSKSHDRLLHDIHELEPNPRPPWQHFWFWIFGHINFAIGSRKSAKLRILTFSRKISCFFAEFTCFVLIFESARSEDADWLRRQRWAHVLRNVNTKINKNKPLSKVPLKFPRIRWVFLHFSNRWPVLGPRDLEAGIPRGLKYFSTHLMECDYFGCF